MGVWKEDDESSELKIAEKDWSKADEIKVIMCGSC